MRRYSYATGALLGILLTTLAIVLITVRTGEMPQVISVWPLFAALGVSAVTWWLQGLIVAVLARPQLKSLRVGDMVRVYMAGGFVWGISPIKGAEVPFEVYLLKRFGLSVGEGSTVVITRVLLDIVILTPAALGGLVLTSNLPNVEHPPLLLEGSTIAGLMAAIILLIMRRRKPSPGGAGWRARGQVKIFRFLGDMQRSLALFSRRGYRATLIYGGIFTLVYWAFRLSMGPLALMAAGWSGDWIPVIVAQLLLFSLVLPLAPTPGGSGAREFGFAGSDDRLRTRGAAVERHHCLHWPRILPAGDCRRILRQSAVMARVTRHGGRQAQSGEEPMPRARMPGPTRRARAAI